MSRVVVLGAGMVGSVIAADLAANPGLDVTIADISEGALTRACERAGGRVKARRADLSQASAVMDAVRDADMVVGALSSRFGYGALSAVIDAGKNYCDISFMEEDFLSLAARARARGVTAVTDCGVAPGMSNILAAKGAAMLDSCEKIEIYVGGLPRERRWPFEYKAGFAPADVIEEYTRPARLVEGGRVVVKEALSEPELMDFEGVGTLEAFNTDGLRSLIETVGKRYGIPTMKEQTLRYPGHIALMRVMRETGLFSKETIEVGGAKVRPLDVTSALLFPQWTYAPGEEDLTVMRVTATGVRGGARESHTWDLLDFYEKESGATSMSRTTAFPCAIVAKAILAGRFREPGVHAPEALADTPGMVEHIMAELSARGVEYRYTRREG